jgi:hypothetical protein
MTTLANSSLLQNIRVMVDSLNAQLSTSLNKAADGVNAIARRNLSGAKNAAPWSYPVPRRSGGLLLNQKTQRTTPANPFTAYVFNLASYAAAVHSGVVNEWAGRGKTRKRIKAAGREFIDDAVAEFQPLMVIQRDIEQGWLRQWT